MVTKKKYDWKITGKKMLLSLLAVIIAGGAVVYTDNPYWLIALPVLTGLNNYFKHS